MRIKRIHAQLRPDLRPIRSQLLAFSVMMVAFAGGVFPAMCDGQAISEMNQEVQKERGREQAAGLDRTSEGEQMVLRMALAADGATPRLEPIPQTTGATIGRVKRSKVVCWQPSEFSHRPLIFEEPCLERSGYCSRPRFASLVSGVTFFSRGAIYPIVIERPR